MEFIDLKTQYQRLKSNIDKRIQTVLDHGKYIMGPEVFELEERLAAYVGVKHCISCANGTDALTLAMMSLGIGKGDIVFCPTFTFFATAEVIASAGATPVFVDSDPRTFNICPKDLKKKIDLVLKSPGITSKAVIAVDLFGLPANYPELREITNENNLFLIEDAAQGFGGSIKGGKAGSFGDISTTSFFPAKPLGCYGDGGALFTDDDNLAELCRSLRVHGKGNDKYDNVRIGLNSRLDTIQAAILLEKLEAFPNELAVRNQAAAIYDEKYSGKFITPYVPDGYVSSYAQYTILVEERLRVRESFAAEGIPTMVYYEKCMHQQTAFRDLNYSDHDFPVASLLAKTVLSLPMHGYMK